MSSDSAETGGAGKKGRRWPLWLGISAVVVVVAVLAALSIPKNPPAQEEAQDFTEKPGLAAVNLFDGFDTDQQTPLATMFGEGDNTVAWVRSEAAEGAEVGNDVLRGVSIVEAKTTWELSLAEQVGHPASVAWAVAGGTKAAFLVSDPTDTDGAGRWQVLVLDVGNGRIVAQREFAYEEIGMLVYLDEERLLLSDGAGGLHCLRASDLNDEIWSSAPAMQDSADGQGYGTEPVLLGKYVATQDGYLNLKDGKPAGFASDAGKNGVFVDVLRGGDNELIRVEPGGEKYRIQGFNPESDSTTWEVEAQDPAQVRRVGQYLLVQHEDQVAGHRLVDGRLEPAWSVECAFCSVVYADDQRVLLAPETGEIEPLLVATSTGEPRADEKVTDQFTFAIEGDEMVYLVTSDAQLVTVKREDFSEQWRTKALNGFIGQAGSRLTVLNSESGLLGVLGGDGDDWDQFEASE